jgi:hypothetical protein
MNWLERIDKYLMNISKNIDIYHEKKVLEEKLNMTCSYSVDLLQYLLDNRDSYLIRCLIYEDRLYDKEIYDMKNITGVHSYRIRFKIYDPYVDRKFEQTYYFEASTLEELEYQIGITFYKDEIRDKKLKQLGL